MTSLSRAYQMFGRGAVDFLRSLELPPGRFFHPTERFWEIVEEIYPGKVFVDCGTGAGDLAHELRERGYKALGIDPAVRDGQIENLVAPVMAETFPFSNRDIAL